MEKQEYEAWIKKSDEDLDVARYNLDGKKFSAALFFMQQSAEKALKALHIKLKGELLRTHDLVILAKSTNAPLDILDFCRQLTPAYQYTRYPDAPETKISLNKLEALMSAAENIIRWVRNQI